MKRVIIISILILIVMYSISLFPILKINERIRNEQYKINSVKSVDLSNLSIKGENFLNNRSKYSFGSQSTHLFIHKSVGCDNENCDKWNLGNLDKVSIEGRDFDSIECLMNYLGKDYVTGISFKGTENCNAYLDKNNNIMLLISNDYNSTLFTSIIVKDIEVYQFYREPIFYYGPLALFDPLRIHFVETFYPIVDRIVLPIYYLFLIIPVIIRIADKNLFKFKVVKYWTKFNITVVIIAVVSYILEIWLMRYI